MTRHKRGLISSTCLTAGEHGVVGVEVVIVSIGGDRAASFSCRGAEVLILVDLMFLQPALEVLGQLSYRNKNTWAKGGV